ncbi:hypothetical protein ABFS82_08G021500 [Erythranthe guttata]|uniref:Homeobox-leucine zipper protein n=1 Tax=Erythranthe guttata TaxID=4155 RepID=A0A022R3B2_ERYGU|nr:PREDICTED: homeobox-leucine zipper protein HOX21-like [Erythranthe guttata]EYU34093.1 hypothetical protein MIMGU_mgv1a011172mg [Erythranthe guttata]|eukprot:XP_012841374.1 PREDICTED: homeobox-leucine zipper protein HOX21-like [Erythranthe guttata]
MAFIPESMFRNHDDHTHFPTSSPNCAPQDFQGVTEYLMRRSMSLTGGGGMDRGEEYQQDDDVSDDGSQMMMLGEKKRRLNMEQVKALEKSFELGNKLEPERKVQLARALGLQPRQVAIWFQNRRARWKTKQLEKDYDVLKRQFDALKSDNDSLKSHNKKLQTQLVCLKAARESTVGIINLNKDNEGSNWSNGSENSSEVNLNKTSSTTDTTLFFPNHHQNNNNNKNGAVYPPAISPNFTQLLHMSSSRPAAAADHIQPPPVSNECFGTMFGGIEETQEFWPWPAEQQNFH